MLASGFVRRLWARVGRGGWLALERGGWLALELGEEVEKRRACGVCLARTNWL